MLSCYLKRAREDFRGLSNSKAIALVNQWLLDPASPSMRTNQLCRTYDPGTENVTIEDLCFDNEPVTLGFSDLIKHLERLSILKSGGVSQRLADDLVLSHTSLVGLSCPLPPGLA